MDTKGQGGVKERRNGHKGTGYGGEREKKWSKRDRMEGLKWPKKDRFDG